MKNWDKILEIFKKKKKPLISKNVKCKREFILVFTCFESISSVFSEDVEVRCTKHLMIDFGNSTLDKSKTISNLKILSNEGLEGIPNWLHFVQVTDELMRNWPLRDTKIYLLENHSQKIFSLKKKLKIS